MQISDIILLYDYNYWANKRILAMADGLSHTVYIAHEQHAHGSLHRTLLHTLDAEYGWRMLIQHRELTEDLSAEDYPTLASIVQRWQEEEVAMRDYLASLQDGVLTTVLRYMDDDIEREWVLWHCLLHVVNHGTQHRSEAAAMLTNYGRSPGDLDFTVFLLNQR